MSTIFTTKDNLAEEHALAYNIQEAADALHVSRPTLKKMMMADDFPAFQQGSRWLISCKGLQLWIDKQIADKNRKF